MKFGAIQIDDALGGILAHQYRAGSNNFSKGHRLSLGDIRALKDAGHQSLIIARLDDNDLFEDDAASLLAKPFLGQGLYADKAHTGRVNLRAAWDGLFVLDQASIIAFNAVDPMITIATLAPFARVKKGDLIATIKIIAFGVSQRLVLMAKEIARPLEVKPFQPLQVTLLQTMLAGTKPKVLNKTAQVTKARVEVLRGAIIREERLPHTQEALSKALKNAQGDMIIIFGASAVCDAEDIIPAAIRAEGGTIERIGMPVDPGNLLVLGALNGVHIIGAPGCARSAKENGFDWVLARLFANIYVTNDDIAAMGIGGLLQEIASRPKKREA